MLMQSNCFRPALNALKDADMLQQKKSLPTQRRYSAEALPPPSLTLAIHVVDFAEIIQMPSARSFLEFLKVKTFRKSLLLVRLPSKSPFTQAILWYNQAIAHLAVAKASDKDTIEKSRVEARHLLELADAKLRKWYACLAKVKHEHPSLVRTTLLLRLLVVHMNSQLLSDSSSFSRQIHALHSQICYHDLNHSVLSLRSLTSNSDPSQSTISV